MNGYRFRKHSLPFGLTALALMFLAAPMALADKPASPAQPDSEPEAVRLFRKIHWVAGPQKVHLGDKAELDLPAGYHFTGVEGAKLFDEMNQNPPSGNELGVIVPDKKGQPNPAVWCILFSYSDIGHVKDDEKDKLNDDTAKATLDSLRQGTEQANVERARRGWGTLQILGWEQKPFYDQATHHITWAVKVGEGTGPQSATNVNYNSRVLGREGVISANLITDPESLHKIVPTYNSLVTNLTYTHGHRYDEFREGDKVAKYGLIGLMTGATAVVAVKMWKPLIKVGAIAVAAIAGLLGKVKSMFKRKAS